MRRALPLLVALLFAAATPGALAHEVRPAYLELRQTAGDTYDVLWKVPARGDGLRLGLYVVPPEGTTNLTPPRGELAGGAHIERWTLRRPGGLEGEIVRIDGLSATLTDVLVRIVRLDGSTQIERLSPASSAFVVAASPGGFEVAATYLGLGVEHILLGPDHLLFVLALLILVTGTRRLVLTITAFTAAHSVTLAGATLGLVHLAGPPVEAVIALSILFVAVEIARGIDGRPGLTARRPWLVAGAFGLVHGFGFAGALSEVGLPQTAIPAALLFFNLGVEIGQLVFIGAAAAVVAIARRALSGRDVARPAIETPLVARLAPAYAIGATAAFLLIDRVASFLI